VLVAEGEPCALLSRRCFDAPFVAAAETKANPVKRIKRAKRRPRSPRARITVSVSERDWTVALNRCLRGEKAADVARDFPGMKYPTLWARVDAAKKAAAAHRAPAAV